MKNRIFAVAMAAWMIIPASAPWGLKLNPASPEGLVYFLFCWLPVVIVTGLYVGKGITYAMIVEAPDQIRMLGRSGAHTIPPYKCQCGYEPNRSASPDGTAPNEGDVSICFKCGKMSAFDKDLKQRELTGADVERMKKNRTWEEAVHVRNMVLKMGL